MSSFWRNCHHCLPKITICRAASEENAGKITFFVSTIFAWFTTTSFCPISTPFWHIICLQLRQWGHYRYDSGSPLKRKCHHFHEIALLPPKMETYSAAKMTTFTCDYGMFTTATGRIATVLVHHDMFATATVGPILTRLWHIMTFVPLMMTSSNGNIFRVTCPLCGEFTGLRWIPRTKASDAELWCFLWSAPN